MDDAEQVPEVEQDQVGHPAERAEQLRRGASSQQVGAGSAVAGAEGHDQTDDPPAAASAAPPGALDREASANLTTTEGESGQRDGEWEADAEGVVQHTSSGSEEPADENPERPR
jgi:hypothetical protein